MHRKIRKMIKDFGNSPLLLLVFGILASCSSHEKRTEDYDEETKVIYSEKAETLFQNMVKPAELPYALMSMGADYDENIPNDPKNSGYYKKSQELAALNLGVYVTDLSYVVAYDNFQAARMLYNAGNDLADFLGEGRIFNQSILQDYGDVIEDDSSRIYINQAISNARVNLREKERARIGTLILSGIFIERLYLATTVLTHYPGDDLPEDVKINVLAPLMTHIYQQKEPLDNLVAYIDEIIRPDDPKIILGELRGLQQDYVDLGSIWNTSGSDASTIVSDIDFQAIGERVSKIRGLIIY